jgi:hypothetical protein
VALAVTGFAVGALKKRSKSFSVASGATAERVAKCKRSQGTAASGGFFAPLTETGSAMGALDSTREGKRKWRFRARNAGLSGTAKAFVYCDKERPKLKTASTRFDVAGGEKGSGTARCASGQEAVAGGFDSPDSTTHPVISKRTDARSWRVTLVNPGSEDHGYTVYAYCDKREPGLKTASETVVANKIEQFNQSAAAQCKRSQEVRSGGFETKYEGEGKLSIIGIVHGSKKQGKRGWRATAFAALGSPPVTAYAYCAKKGG